MNELLFRDNLKKMFTELDNGNVIIATVDPESGPSGMTIAWGFFGIMWNEYTFIAAIRPSRYTYRGIKSSGRFTVNFLGSEYKEALAYFGSVSGYDENKFEKGYLEIDENNTDFSASFIESNIVLECEVTTANQIEPFVLKDEYTEKNYRKDNGFHTMIYGKIVNMKVK